MLFFIVSLRKKNMKTFMKIFLNAVAYRECVQVQQDIN